VVVADARNGPVSSGKPSGPSVARCDGVATVTVGVVVVIENVTGVVS
jgi:hypothetical protein